MSIYHENSYRVSAAEKVVVQKTDLEKLGLKGPVKEVREYRYKAFKKDNKTYLGKTEENPDGKTFVIKRFNEQGGLIEYIAYRDGGYKTTKTYADDGLILEINEENPRGALYEKYVYTYNDKRLLVKEAQFHNDRVESTSEKVYEYDENDNMTLWIYKSGEHLSEKSEYRYNNKGYRVEYKRTNSLGAYMQTETYKNNPKGHIIETSYLNEDGTLRHKQIHADDFDVNGDRKKVEVEDENTHKPWQMSYGQSDTHGNMITRLNYYRTVPVNIDLKDIFYYGEEPLQHPLHRHQNFFTLPIDMEDATKMEWNEEMKEAKKGEENNWGAKMTVEDAKWLAERSTTPDAYPLLSHYLLKFKEFPSQFNYIGDIIDAIALLKELEENLNAKIIHSFKMGQSFGDDYPTRYTLIFPDSPGYMIHAAHISKLEGESYSIPQFVDDHHDEEDEVLSSQIVFLRPSDISENRDETGVEQTIKDYIQKCTLERKPDKPEIYMVEVSKGEFSLQSHPVKEDFEIEDLDIQYGYGFEKFHEDLMDRFTSESKGLVLFHGLPGTGKTYYIRHLLKEMAEAHKVVIYMPPNMVDHLVEPSFMTFLSQTVAEYSEDGLFCVLLIEDAEPLLASRSSDTRIQGVTNLLNMTDGLLNDMLKLQIICTFNVELAQIDAALLRPGRLIARKEFKALPELDANLLAQSLGIKHNFTSPATLSEIYALLKNKNTLIHDEY